MMCVCVCVCVCACVRARGVCVCGKLILIDLMQWTVQLLLPSFAKYCYIFRHTA